MSQVWIRKSDALCRSVHDCERCRVRLSNRRGGQQDHARVQASASPNLGQEAFAGTSQIGTETHFGLGVRDGRLIMSATHAGDIPVTPENSNSLITLGGAELTTAKEVLGP